NLIAVGNKASKAAEHLLTHIKEQLEAATSQQSVERGKSTRSTCTPPPEHRKETHMASSAWARGPPIHRDRPATQSPSTAPVTSSCGAIFLSENTMSMVEAFRNLVMMLLIEPASDHVDELLAELVAQAALNVHQANGENLMLRCVRWDNPGVYYAL